MNVFDLPSAWRDSLMPAAYNGARFHCEANARESGRRIVEHEFPKKDLPYAEDMGRHAREFTVRGYCIVYPYDSEILLYRRDYRTARNLLIDALEKEGPGVLQLPTQPSQMVLCARYRMTEEERVGGFCTFDMTFLELGLDPQRWAPSADTADQLQKSSKSLRDETKRVLAPPPKEIVA
jgi:prophage DNA circulation protein